MTRGEEPDYRNDSAADPQPNPKRRFEARLRRAPQREDVGEISD